jgi:hypothetical protein
LNNILFVSQLDGPMLRCHADAGISRPQHPRVAQPDFRAPFGQQGLAEKMPKSQCPEWVMGQ